MTEKAQTSRSTLAKPTEARPGLAAEPPRGSKVPPEAEDFEHTIRRMIQERDQKRRSNEGLYL